MVFMLRIISATYFIRINEIIIVTLLFSFKFCIIHLFQKSGNFIVIKFIFSVHVVR